MTGRRNNIGFTCPGSKQKLAPDIVRFLPKRGRKFIDLFAGRANIALHAMDHGYEYDEWILNDIRKFTFLQAVKDYGDKITVPTRSDIDPDRMAELAAQGDPVALLIEPYSTFNGAGYEAGGSRTEGGRRTPESYEAALRGAHRLLNERNVRITSVDWYDCLKAEQPGKDCAVVIDAPYLECDVYAYYPDDICPTELIAYLQSAEHPWVLCEHDQPLYRHAFGEPACTKTVQLRATNLGVTGGQEQRTECIWRGPLPEAQRSVTVTFQPVPDDRQDDYYSKLPMDKLLQEIRDAIGCITTHRNQMNREMRERLLPALLELRKRTYRQNPGYYETLAKMGLNGACVRQWFYRSHTADEVIALVEENKQEEPKRTKTEHNPLNELQTEVVAALVSEGCKQKEAVSLVETAKGDDFISLFEAALAQRSGLTVVTESAPQPVPPTTAPEVITPSAPDNVNLLASELIRDLDSASRLDKLRAVVESRQRLNPTLWRDLLRALKNITKIEQQLSEDYEELPNTGKAHQRIVRERVALLPESNLDEKQRLAADFKNANVREISYDEARKVILQYEYLGNMGTTKFSYGLYFGEHLAGVECFGVTGGANVDESVCGPEHADQVITLVRGACAGLWAHRNSASYLITRACREMTKKGYNIFVAYADPRAGEEGRVYRSCNWLYCGMTSPTEQYKTPDGTVHDARQVQCLTRDRTGGATTYKRTRSQQKQLMIEKGYEFFKDSGRKLRYVGIYGDRRTKRLLRRALRWEVMAYPKRKQPSSRTIPAHGNAMDTTEELLDQMKDGSRRHD
jgi:hypothetical protein